MVSTIPDILAQIVEHKRAEVESSRIDREALEAAAEASIATRRDFREALLSHQPSIIAEIKKASPSKGVLSEQFEPASIAASYECGGAAALSVLTDALYFHGSLGHLKSARDAVRLPVLRKDFTIDERQIVEAAAHQADAILLIASLLSERQLRDYREFAARFHLASLVEVHDEEELEKAVASGADTIGVNNRDLRTFQVNLQVAVRLAERIPASVVRVAESGIRSSADLQLLRSAGYHGFLIGEYLMKSENPAAAVRALLR